MIGIGYYFVYIIPIFGLDIILKEHGMENANEEVNVERNNLINNYISLY